MIHPPFLLFWNLLYLYFVNVRGLSNADVPKTECCWHKNNTFKHGLCLHWKIKIQFAFAQSQERKLVVADFAGVWRNLLCQEGTEGAPVTCTTDDMQMSHTNKRAFHAVPGEGDYICVIYIWHSHCWWKANSISHFSVESKTFQLLSGWYLVQPFYAFEEGIIRVI